MKTLAAAASALVLLGYVMLMRADPSWGLFYPRGGVAALGFSLVIANAAIWMASQPRRPVSLRFQLGAAGWIWLIVQGGGLAWVYSQAGAA